MNGIDARTPRTIATAAVSLLSAGAELIAAGVRADQHALLPVPEHEVEPETWDSLFA